MRYLYHQKVGLHEQTVGTCQGAFDADGTGGTTGAKDEDVLSSDINTFVPEGGQQTLSVGVLTPELSVLV